MAKVKVKFRNSKVIDNEGKVYYQVIHEGEVRRLNTKYSLFSYEWDKENSSVIVLNGCRYNYLLSIKESIYWDIRHLQSIINIWDAKRVEYTVDNIISSFYNQVNEQSLFNFMQIIINQLQQMGKQRTSETYRCTLKSFMQFRENKDVLLEDIDSDLMLMYEAYLRGRGLTKNSTSFYMRILRAVYNRAVEKDLTANRNPFKHVYTGIDKTIKRAVPLKVIKRIKEMDFSMNPTFDFARDMFLMSFYTRGMSFVDMAYLRKKDLQNGVLSYRRRKTGQQLFVKWEKCMQGIVDKYDTSQSNYLLPIIKPFSNIDERKQYIYAAHNINRCLKIVGKELGLSVSLTLYVARHAWASIAKGKNVPLSVISEGMGHDSEATTRIYLASLDTMAIDKANSMILKSL